MFDIDDLPQWLLNSSIRRLTQRGTPHRQPRMGRSGAGGTARGQARISLPMSKKKIRFAQHATDIKNAGGFIVKAIEENYQDPVFQKQLKSEKAKETQAMLASLKNEMLEKQNALLRQAVRTTPELLEQAAAKISSGFIRERLLEYDSIADAYAAGSVVAGDINNILAKDLCADLIAPVIAAYEDEKARILEKVG